MVKIKTESGFECEVNENSMQDWRFIHAMRDMSQKDPLVKMQGVYNMILLIIGEDGERRLMDHVADDTGFVDAIKIAAEVNELVGKLRDTPLKNS